MSLVAAPVRSSRSSAASPVERITLREKLQGAEDVLAAVQRFDVKPGPFTEYLGVLRQAANTLTSPTGRPWLGSQDRDRLFYEAASQVTQLVDSFQVWRREDPDVVRAKLRRICEGSPLPPLVPHDDGPRNALAELACAAILQRKGFWCALTNDEEDVTASFPGLMPFAVEAKRPAHRRSLAKNAKTVRQQLEKRIAGGSKQGLAVFAADRILGLTDGDLVLDRADQLDAVLGRQVARIVRELQHPRHRLFPRAALGAVLSTGAVFCVDPGFIVTISAMAFFCTGPEDHPLSDRLHRALRATMDHTQVMG